MISRLKIFVNKHPILTVMRIIIFAITIALLVNLLSGGHLYKSGLFLVLILMLFDIMKPKKK